MPSEWTREEIAKLLAYHREDLTDCDRLRLHIYGGEEGEDWQWVTPLPEDLLSEMDDLQAALQSSHARAGEAIRRAEAAEAELARIATLEAALAAAEERGAARERAARSRSYELRRTRERLFAVQGDIESYADGDRAPSPPVALLREERALLARVADLTAHLTPEPQPEGGSDG